MGQVPGKRARGPSPVHSATQVLDEVLTAFENASSGTSTFYAFASDSLRAKAGELSDLRRMFSNELFAPLVGRHERLVESLDERGEVARAVVRAGDASFVISLARRDHGRAPGCWLISAIARDQGAGFL